MERRTWLASDGQWYEIRLWYVPGEPGELLFTRLADERSWRVRVRLADRLLDLGTEELEGLLQRAKQSE